MIDSTLNDVLLACIAGSIRSYLTTKTNIINPPDLTVSIPVDIKPQTPIESSLTGVNYVLSNLFNIIEQFFYLMI